MTTETTPRRLDARQARRACSCHGRGTNAVCADFMWGESLPDAGRRYEGGQPVRAAGETPPPVTRDGCAVRSQSPHFVVTATKGPQRPTEPETWARGREVIVATTKSPNGRTILIRWGTGCDRHPGPRRRGDDQRRDGCLPRGIRRRRSRNASGRSRPIDQTATGGAEPLAESAALPSADWRHWV